jgi:hypothetical protein
MVIIENPVQPSRLTDAQARFYGDKTLADVKANITTWQLNAQWVNGDLTNTVKEYDDAYDADLDPDTRNHRTTQRKKDARKALDDALHHLIELLRGNVLVTDQDEERLGIYKPIPDNHPIPTTLKFPLIHVEQNYIRRITGYFTVDGQEGFKGKPDGVASTQLAYGICKEEPKNVKELIHLNVDQFTRNSFILDFEDEERGQKVYMAARYVMRASSSGYGPWSEMCYAIIP